MKEKVCAILFAVALMTLGFFSIAHNAHATSTFRDAYDTAHGNPPGTTPCTFCHGPSGPPLNSTGQALLASANPPGSTNFDYCSIGPATGSCAASPPTCTSFTYSDWGACQNGTQTRTVASSLPSGCTGGSPVLNQSCTDTPPTCTSFTYSDWGACQNGTQTRTVASSSPAGCTGGSPVLSQSCTDVPPTPGTGPDMTAWVGKWFKVSIEHEGDHFETEGFLQIESWDPANKIFQSTLFYETPQSEKVAVKAKQKKDSDESDNENVQWNEVPLLLTYVSGTNLDFLFSSQLNLGTASYAFTDRAKGKVYGGTLIKAMFDTVRGYFVQAKSSHADEENDDHDDDEGGWLKVEGKMIPQSKVPPEIQSP